MVMKKDACSTFLYLGLISHLLEPKKRECITTYLVVCSQNPRPWLDLHLHPCPPSQTMRMAFVCRALLTTRILQRSIWLLELVMNEHFELSPKSNPVYLDFETGERVYFVITNNYTSDMVNFAPEYHSRLLSNASAWPWICHPSTRRRSIYQRHRSESE